MSLGATIGAWAGYALGGIDDALIALLALACVDYVTGCIGAVHCGDYCSSKCYRGLFKKFFIFVMVAVCHGVDIVLNINVMREAAIFAYALNEAVSIVENIDRMGFGDAIPAPVRRALSRLKERDEYEEGSY